MIDENSQLKRDKQLAVNEILQLRQQIQIYTGEIERRGRLLSGEQQANQTLMAEIEAYKNEIGQLKATIEGLSETLQRERQIRSENGQQIFNDFPNVENTFTNFRGEVMQFNQYQI